MSLTWYRDPFVLCIEWTTRDSTGQLSGFYSRLKLMRELLTDLYIPGFDGIIFRATDSS